MRSIYLAGPDVFLPDAIGIGREKQRLCREHGFEGLFPLDAQIEPTGAGAARAIFEANVAMIRRCDAVIAHLTPFRGPSADAGTVFEVGMAFALAKPVFGYTNDALDYAARVPRGAAPLVADDGTSVEDFGLFDNLMIAEALRAQGRDVVARQAPSESRLADLSGFALCLRQARAFFAADGAAST